MAEVTFEPAAHWKAPTLVSFDGIRRLIFLDRYAQKHESVPDGLSSGAVGVADARTGGRMAVVYEGPAEGGRVRVRSLDTGTVYELPAREIDWVKETVPSDAWKRMAKAQAEYEAKVGTSPVSLEEWERRYEWLLSDFRFVPGGRIWAMLGTGLERTAYNCFVLPMRANDGSSQDSRKAILDTLSNMVEIMARGGGVGINLGTLRPRKARVRGVEGRSSGSVAWGEIFSFATGLVSQGGCFASDQLIPTDRGEIPAKELYERITAGERLYAFTHLGRRRFVAAFANGRKLVFRVTTTSGKSIDITGDHRIATSAVGRFDGFRRGIPMRKVRLQDLRVGDRILSMTEPWLMAEEEIVSIAPLGEMDVYDFEVEEAHMFVVNGLYVSNSRRGALMLMLPVWHPDVFDFITAKKDMTRLTHANISVILTDEFEEALRTDREFRLEFPDYEAVPPEVYDREWDGDLKKWKAKGYPTRIYQTVRARELWRTIIESAWASAEPGIVRLDYANRMSNSWYFAPLISTNPCSEQYLPAWGVCNLGHLNLPRFLEVTGRDEQGPLCRVNWDALAKATHLAVRFLHNIIDITPYFFEENEKVQKSERRIGLGTMGLGELLIRMRQRYGSETSLALIRQIYRFIRDEAYKASVALAKEKGPFLQFDAERFLASGFMQTMPDEIRDAIRRHGIRNVTLLTQAPTGSTGTMAGTSTGIEPYYQFVYTRKGELGEHVVVEPVALDMGWYDAAGVRKVDRLPHYAVTAMDLSPEDHVRVQAAIQEFTDASLSKTVNVPNTFTVEETERLYNLALGLGVKGITIYRDRSRNQQVLSILENPQQTRTKEVKDTSRSGLLLDRTASDVCTSAVPSEGPIVFSPFIHVDAETLQRIQADAEAWLKRLSRPPVHRPDVVEGITERVETPLGKLYVTVNHDDQGRIIEVFIRGPHVKRPHDRRPDAAVSQDDYDKALLELDAMTAAIGMVLSEALKWGADPARLAAQLTAAKGNIFWHRAEGDDKGRLYRSLLDAVAAVMYRAMRRVAERAKATSHNGEGTTQTVAVSESLQAASGPHPPVARDDMRTSAEPPSDQVAWKPVGSFSVSSEHPDRVDGRNELRPMCPQCGGVLRYEDCWLCPSCGWSKCG